MESEIDIPAILRKFLERDEHSSNEQVAKHVWDFSLGAKRMGLCSSTIMKTMLVDTSSSLYNVLTVGGRNVIAKSYNQSKVNELKGECTKSTLQGHCNRRDKVNSFHF